MAGAGIADKRWTSERKKIIIESRVATANLIFSKIKELQIPLNGFISASGSNFYGAKTGATIYAENRQSRVLTFWEMFAYNGKKQQLNLKPYKFR